MLKSSISNGASVEGSCHLNEVETAKWLHLSRRTLQNWRVQGEGPPFQKFGRSVRYAVSAVEAWIAERERSSTSASTPANLWGLLQPDLLSEIKKGERS